MRHAVVAESCCQSRNALGRLCDCLHSADYPGTCRWTGKDAVIELQRPSAGSSIVHGYSEQLSP